MNFTEVIYKVNTMGAATFTNKIIGVKPDEVTLKDFKSLFESRHHVDTRHFRFFFKYDNFELEMVVQEEVSNIDERLPLLGGRVNAWIVFDKEAESRTNHTRDDYDDNEDSVFDHNEIFINEDRLTNEHLSNMPVDQQPQISNRPMQNDFRSSSFDLNQSQPERLVYVDYSSNNPPQRFESRRSHRQQNHFNTWAPNRRTSYDRRQYQQQREDEYAQNQNRTIQSIQMSTSPRRSPRPQYINVQNTNNLNASHIIAEENFEDPPSNEQYLKGSDMAWDSSMVDQMIVNTEMFDDSLSCFTDLTSVSRNIIRPRPGYNHWNSASSDFLEKCRKNFPTQPIDPVAWVDHVSALRDLQLIEEEEPSVILTSELHPHQQQNLTPSTTSTIKIEDLNTELLTNNIPTNVSPPGSLGPMKMGNNHCDIFIALKHPDSGLKLRDRCWFKLVIQSTFLGRDLVKWLKLNVSGIGKRKDGAKLAQELMNYGFFFHALPEFKKKTKFSQNRYYQFRQFEMSRLNRPLPPVPR